MTPIHRIVGRWAFGRPVLAIVLAVAALAGIACPRDAASQEQPTEIVELARALKNSPDLIYEYIYNNIETLPQYGSLKGPLGTLLDGKGTAFDQAELMIALLQQAGIPAAFVIGEIELNASQLSDWLGVDDSPGSVSITLGTGGFSGSVTVVGGVVTKVSIGWAWVQANIGGTNYVFDPSTKSYNRSSGLTPTTIAGALGYDQSTFVSAALSGSSTTLASITGVNRPNIRQDLTAYTNRFVQYLRANSPAAATAAILGGKSIVPLPIGTQLRQTVLPRQVGFATTYSALPSAFRTTLTLQLGSNDSSGTFSPLSCTGMSAICKVTYNSSDIYGHRIVASFDASGIPSLLVDGVSQVKATTVVPGGRQLTIRTSIVHSYAQSFANITDNDQIRVKPFLNIIYLISTGWGQVGRGMIEKHRRLLQQNIAQNPADPSAEPVLGESLAMLGYTWLAELSQQQTVSDQIAATTAVYHHAVGVVGTKPVGTSSGPFVDLPLNSVGITQRVMRPSLVPVLTPIESAAFFCWGIFLSIAESGMLEQTQPGATAASTVKLIDTAVQAGGQIFDINNSAIPGDNAAYYSSTIRPVLAGSYGAGDLARIDALVSPQNLRVIAPANGAINIDQYTGAGYFQINQAGTAIGAIITGGLSGGEPASPVSIAEIIQNTPFTLTPSWTQTFEISNAALSSLGNAGGFFGTTRISDEPINLVTGDYLLNTTDLAVGSLDMPHGLSFQRYYDSGTRLQEGPLGFGWTHSFAITALVNSDAFEGLAINSPVNGAATIAATFVTLDILNDGVTTNKPLARIVIASVVQRWLMDQLKDNIVAVRQPGYVQHFVKLTDGTYNAPLGVGARLMREDGAYTYLAKDRTTLSFDTAGNLSTWTTPSGARISLGYTGSPARLASVTNNLGRELAPLE